jgi:hypothetical protein
MKLVPAFRRRVGAALLGAAALSLIAPAVQASVAAAPVQHVLLISVDGMHAVDLQNYVAAHKNSTLAALVGSGVVYPNASTTRPSDSFPGMVAQLTGGTSKSTGIYYDVSYNRTLLPPGSSLGAKPGTGVAFDESIDNDLTLLNGGGGINSAALPIDPITGKPIYPHNYLRVNTVFEVIKAANPNARTAWSDKHRAYEIVNGPSGNSVDDLFTPEINSNTGVVGSKIVDRSSSPSGTGLADSTLRVKNTEAYDASKVAAIVNEINGLDSSGTNKVVVPVLFGMNFQAVSVGEKLTAEPAQLAGNDTDPLVGLPGGYRNSDGTPSSNYAQPGPVLSDALDFVDQSLGKMVVALKAQGLYDSTAIIISAKHGQSPINYATLRKEANSPNPVVTDPGVTLGDVALGAGTDQSSAEGEIQDDVALIWIQDQSKTAADVAKLNTPAIRAQDGIGSILSGAAIVRGFGDPKTDPRVPDIIVVTQPGVIYSGSKRKVAEHGGFNHDDTNVLLLVEKPNLTSATINAPVQTTQIAPTILHLLGVDSGAPSQSKLQAVKLENTDVLPGLGL